MGFNYNVLPTCSCSNVAETSISLAGLNPTGAPLGASDSCAQREQEEVFSW